MANIEENTNSHSDCYSSLPFFKEVAKYFMDFLETDFHKRRLPKRNISIRNPDGLQVGVDLTRYESFNNKVWKEVENGFTSGHLRTIKKGGYKANIPKSLLKLVTLQAERVTDEQIVDLVSDISKKVSLSVVNNSNDFDLALTEAKDSTANLISSHFASSFIDERLAQPLKKLGLGDDVSLHSIKENLTNILTKLLEPALLECVTALSLAETISVNEKLNNSFQTDLVKKTMIEYFEFLNVGDVFAEINELERNRQILDKQELYLNLFDISFEKEKYPIFYIPFEAKVAGNVIELEFDPKLYLNRKALEYIVQEYNDATGNVGSLISTSDRIKYLSQHSNNLPDTLQNIVTELVNFFETDASFDLCLPGPQESHNQYVRISKTCYFTLFDKSDESLVNDYENILQLLDDEDSPIAASFIDLLNEFILGEEPPSYTSAVENEWDDLPSCDKLVYASPIPLNSEQRQIMSALKKDGCNYITVEGPPGTGKSHTITAIVCDAVLNGQSILVLSDKKEALDVVEDKISETMNKVRRDREFQNPILRLGKTGSSYSQILSTASLRAIKNHYRAVRNQSKQLDKSIQAAQNDLCRDINREIEAYCEVDINDIARHTKLENHFSQHNSYVDIDELANSPNSAAELDELRNVMLKVNEVFFENNTAQILVCELLGFDLQFLVSLDDLIALLKYIGSLLSAVDLVRKTHPEASGLMYSFESFRISDWHRLKSYIHKYINLHSKYFGYFFKGKKLADLNKKFIQEFPNCKFTIPHKNLNECIAICDLLQPATNFSVPATPKSLPPVDSVWAYHQLLTREDMISPLSQLVDLLGHLEKSKEVIACYGSTMAAARVSVSSLKAFRKNAFTSMSDNNFGLIIEYIYLRQKMTNYFDNNPEIEYGNRIKSLESLVTTKMTHMLDGKVVKFSENKASTAKTLRDIIKKKQPFPQKAFSSLRDAFPCILAGIRDYAEYIPLQPELFDLVIIDEASQVSIAQAFPAILRAKKVLVLGDKKQFSNVKATLARTATNMEYRNKLESTFKQYVTNEDECLAKLPYFDIKHSILEFMEFIKNCNISLLKHFRCYKEIICYSNEHFYGRSLQVIKIRGKIIADVLKFTILDSDDLLEQIPNTNSKEIDFIIEELQRLKSSGYFGSVGVITPHTNQQKLIAERIRNHSDRDYYYSEFRLKIMTFDTCQGEERDTIYYSMVATKNHDHLYGVFPRELYDIENLEGKLREQRLNVGFSRAKECMHFILSKPVEEFRGSIGDALKYYQRTLQRAKDEPMPSEVDPNSPMEKEVLNWVTQTNFWKENRDCLSLTPQFQIGEYLRQLDSNYNHPNYKVDFLLVYKPANGKERNIIIEYDGFIEHFGGDPNVNAYNYRSYYSEQDLYREKVIESYGYRFIRINKFNSGDDPIVTLNKRLEDVVNTKNDDPALLNRLQANVDGLQNGDKKECSKCGKIKDLKEFYDSELITGYGRICNSCKARSRYW